MASPVKPKSGGLRYPIRAVARLTGLSLDLLRAWERRYGVVQPQRGSRGRLYTDAHVRRLRLLRELVARGHAIGELAARSDADLRALLERSEKLAHRGAPPREPLETRVGLQPVWDAIDAFDYAETDRQLGLLATLLTPRDFVHHAALPLMREVGERWHAGSLSIAQEHMTSAVLRNLLGALVRLHATDHPPATLLFTAPEGEQHEFGLMAAAMLAAGGGLGVVYLGPNLPATEIARMARSRMPAKPAAVVLSVSEAKLSPAMQKQLRHLAARLPNEVELWLGGPEALAKAEKLPERIVPLHDFSALEHHLQRLGARF